MINPNATWRDPAGFVWREGGRVFRAVIPEEAEATRALLNATWFKARITAGQVPQTRWLNQGESAPNHPQASEYVWLEHEVLEFPCYPHEISAMQLFDAAKLTLGLAQEALVNGWTLKDASAWNVLFNQGKPVFCDVLSFEQLDPTLPAGVWVAYAQFCRHFLLPLLLYRELHLHPAEQFLTHRDGITPERAAPMLQGLGRLKQPALELVTLPQLFAKKGAVAVANAAKRPVGKPNQPELNAYLLNRVFKRLEAHLEAVRPDSKQNNTTWANYEVTRHHYKDLDLEVKHQFVKQALEESPGSTVLDLGCNAGEFSLLAASLGKQVVAADFDDGALSSLYLQIRMRGANVSPIKLDVGRPTPAVGWMNREVPSFIDRARGKFACVMALGLLHHLLVTERIPLGQVVQLMRALEPKHLIVEWIEPEDSRFVELLGLNKARYKPVRQDEFEAELAKHYRLVSKQQLPVCLTRTLYHWEDVQ